MEEQIKSLIENYGKQEQRTAEWFVTRSNRITASECYKAMSTATYSQRRELIESKLINPIIERKQSPLACLWGTYFEPIAKFLYQEKENIDQIVDLSCVIHPDYDFLGASPDGLLVTKDERNGRLLELKCPISRSFDDNSPIPIEYYHQMQMQLHCTGLMECVYLETKFKQLSYAEWLESPNKKGCFALKKDQVSYCNTTYDEWYSTLTNVFEWNVIFWIVEKTRTSLVQKDPCWLTDHIQSFKQTWDEVLEYRKSGTLPVPKEKGILVLNI